MFTEQEQERIAAAVEQAERRTAGEIVPFVVERSDDYDEARWRAAVLGALLAQSAFLLVRAFTGVWLPVDLVTSSLAALAAGGALALLVRYAPALERLLVGSQRLDQRVLQRATQAFVEAEVFATRERTGILIFLSLRERRVRVIGDAGINARVDQAEWDDVVRRIVAGMRSGTPVDGLVDAIQQCGALLEKRGVEVRPDDQDELGNAPRLGDQG